MSDYFDVIVVGGGPGGLTAATQAARRGASVALVAEGPLGGDCTHTGCVPSKALLAAAAAGRSFAEAMAAVHIAVERVAATEDAAALERRGVTVIRGRAELVAPRRVAVEGVELRGRDIVVATGATAALPPVSGLDRIEVITNETVFSLDRQPEDLAVIGGGAVGCELAQAFARLGTRVTVVEVADRVLPLEDPAASAVVEEALSAGGVDVRVGARIEQASRAGATRRLQLADGTEVAAEQVLVAAGRRPVTAELGLDRVGVEVDSIGRIVVGDRCETNVAGVWAVGDVTQLGGFTHVAAHMGFVAAANIARSRIPGPRAKIDRRVVPRVTFTDPEVAHVGMSEAEAATVGGRVSTVSLDHVDRAVTSGRTAGFVKLIAGPRRVLRSVGGGRVLGATIVAPRAGDLIAEVALAMRARVFTGRLAQTIHPYPTWSSALQQAATGFFFDSEGVEVRPARP